VLREIIKNASGDDWFLISVKNHETISNNVIVSSRKLSCESERGESEEDLRIETYL